MKKLFYLFLVLSSLFVLPACDNKTEEAHEDAEEQADDHDHEAGEEHHDEHE